jgi:hypothetical protein
MEFLYNYKLSPRSNSLIITAVIIINSYREQNLHLLKPRHYSNITEYVDRALSSKSVINKLCFQLSSKSRLSILLCRLLWISLVWPTLISNLLKLKQHFVHVCKVGSAIFYVSMTNYHMKT